MASDPCSRVGRRASTGKWEGVERTSSTIRARTEELASGRESRARSSLFLSIRRTFVLVIGAVLHVGVPARGQGYRVESHALGGVEPSTSLPRSSPDGCHVAVVVRTARKVVVLHDGEPGGELDEIDEASIVFSPDSSRLAYAARLDGAWVVVADGKPGPSFDDIGAGSPFFTADSRHIVYRVQDRKRQRLVIDGVAGPDHGQIAREMALSADGKRCLYVATETGRLCAVVVDGKPDPEYERIGEGSLSISPDSKHVAYAAARGSTWYVPRDGVRGPGYGGVIKGSLRFSPDSKHFCCALESLGKPVLIIDGVAGKPYDVIEPSTVRWSPDSSRLLYAAMRERKWHWIVNGEETQECEAMGDSSQLSPDGRELAFVGNVGGSWFLFRNENRRPVADGAGGLMYSPDGRRLAFFQLKGDVATVVVDGQEDLSWDTVGDGSLIFSPDSRHFAYAARKLDRWFVVVDGKPGLPKAGIVKGSIVFSPDSLHVAYKATVGPNQEVVVLDDGQGPISDWLSPNGPTFREGGTLEYAGYRGRQLWLVKHISERNQK
jgi:hypothetical protein